MVLQQRPRAAKEEEDYRPPARLPRSHVATASLTGLPNNHRDFDLPIAKIIHAGCPHHYRFAKPGESEEDFATRLAAELDELIVKEGADTVAAFFAEPVMGAGGVLVPPTSYFDKIQQVLRKHDVLLVADEVICGFGRLGTMFGMETYGMKPDIVTVAKQISSGYQPISATIISAPIFEALVAQSDKMGLFAHGFTYSGHPVAAAVALETLKIYEERGILDHVRAIAPHFQERLRRLGAHPLVGEARGVGLVGALELVRDKTSKEPFDPALGVGGLAYELAQEEGLIVRAIGDALAICPPLIISDDEIDQLFDRLGTALDRTAAELLSGRRQPALKTVRRSRSGEHDEMTFINCDMGESFGIYRLGDDSAICPSSRRPMSPADSTRPISTICAERSAWLKHNGVKVGAHRRFPTSRVSAAVR